MNIKFNLKTDLNKERTLEKTKSVLFRCMLKMQELATINCPVDTGRLSWGIKIFPTSIGFSKYLLYDNVEYAEAIEFGTDPHVIKIKNKKVLANKKKGQILSLASDHVSVMDLESFETIEVPMNSELEGQLTENDNVEYWEIEEILLLKRKI